MSKLNAIINRAGVLGTGMIPVTTHSTAYGLASSNGLTTDGGRHTRYRHFAITEFSAFRFVYGNYVIQNAVPGELASGNNIIVKASLEMVNGATAAFKYVSSSTAYASGTTYAANDVVTSSGTTYVSLAASNTGHTPASNPTWWQPVVYYPVTFNGASTVTIPSGGYAVSDVIYAQPGPTAQQVFYSNTLVQPNNGTANTGSYPGGPLGSTSSVQGDWVKKSTTGSAPADYTLSAPTTDTSDGFSSSTPGYGPMAIIGYPKAGLGKLPVVIYSGDSYTQGSGESSVSLFNYDMPSGWPARLLSDNPSSPTKIVYPFWIDGKGTAHDSYSVGAGRKIRSIIYQGGTIFVDQMGINDIAANGSLTALQTFKLAKWQAAGALGMKVIVAFPPPETTSTDNWATTTNQTPVAGFGASSLWTQYKAWLLTFPHPSIYAVIDCSSSVVDATGYLWNPAYSDGVSGIHPNTAGHIQIATASNVYYASAPSTAVTISQSGLFGISVTS